MVRTDNLRVGLGGEFLPVVGWRSSIQARTGMPGGTPLVAPARRGSRRVVPVGPAKQVEQAE